MKKPRKHPKPKAKPTKTQPKEDFNQAAFRVVQGVAGRTKPQG